MTEADSAAWLSTPAPFGKIRGILVATAVFWTLMSLVTVYGNTQLSTDELEIGRAHV